MPWKPITITSSMMRCCSASSPLRGRSTSALMPRSSSAFSTPFLAMFQNPAELLVTKANLYFSPPPPAPGAGAAAPPPPSPDFLQPLPTANIANAAIKPVRASLRIVIVVISLWYSRSGAFLSLPGGSERGSPGVEHAHITQRVGPGHRRPGRLERRKGVRHQLSLDGVRRHLGLDGHGFRLLAVAVNGV